MIANTLLSRHYATAIAHSLAAPSVDRGTIVDKLLEHLRNTGRLKLLPGILRELKVRAKSVATEKPFLEVALEKDRQEALRRACDMGLSEPDVSINTELIRGWRIRSAGTLMDRSAKHALINLYQTLIN